ncbi:DUF2269 domain-containing protein [Kiloniella laminariae]|uniref:DUF2269 domain-containing protein n=1 Tax=Kiloniella laminariae TaxID=454162 RepID=A0ABT4LDU0_9PROT|nr:DUF2269 domain-containing protein [Kiloniella laminariae]MCZ4279249.1 DUF2269 domain-containing protein [Kiloniella laminariae]
MDYLLLKWIHIVSSTILFGTGIGSAFYMFVANRSRDTAAIYFVVRHVVWADWIFTTPAVIIQLATGLALVEVTGASFEDAWLFWGVTLYFFAGACWLPVVWLQIRMCADLRDCLEDQTVLPARYWRYERWWIVLGSLAFPAVLLVFYLMVFRPLAF